MFIWRRSIYAHSILWNMCHLLMAKIDIKLNSHVPDRGRHLFTASSSHQKTNFHHHFMTSNILLPNNTDFISISFPPTSRRNCVGSIDSSIWTIVDLCTFHWFCTRNLFLKKCDWWLLSIWRYEFIIQTYYRMVHHSERLVTNLCNKLLLNSFPYKRKSVFFLVKSAKLFIVIFIASFGYDVFLISIKLKICLFMALVK